MEDFISVKVAAQLLGNSPQAVHRLVNRGTLGAKRVGLAMVLSRRAVLELKTSPAYILRSRRARGIPDQEVLDLKEGA